MQSTATQHAVNAVIMRVVSLRMGWPVCFKTVFFIKIKMILVRGDTLKWANFTESTWSNSLKNSIFG